MVSRASKSAEFETEVLDLVCIQCIYWFLLHETTQWKNIEDVQ